MNRKSFRSPILLIFLFLYAGCERKDGPSSGEGGSAKSFEVRGVIQDIRQEGRILIIDHEEIPGYMRQMIMPFEVAEGEPDRDLKPGDEIEFVYEVEEIDSWIRDIRKTGVTKPIKVADVENLPGPEGVPLLGVGDVMPDYTFLDQDGKETSLHRYRGMPVAMTFVFSRCPMPEYCPAMMRNFNEVEEALKSDPDAPAKWKLLSISFDTWFDTPETMSIYGEAYGRDSASWSLLSTDDCCTINEIAGNVGLKFADKDGSFIHNLRTVVLDSEGVIARVFTDETWNVDQLVSEMKRLGSS